MTVLEIACTHSWVSTLCMDSDILLLIGNHTLCISAHLVCCACFFLLAKSLCCNPYPVNRESRSTCIHVLYINCDTARQYKIEAISGYAMRASLEILGALQPPQPPPGSYAYAYSVVWRSIAHECCVSGTMGRVYPMYSVHTVDFCYSKLEVTSQKVHGISLQPELPKNRSRSNVDIVTFVVVVKLR